MRVRTITLLTTPQSLASLVDDAPRHTGSIGIQNNTIRDIMFGDHKDQSFVLRPKANANLKIVDIKNLWLRATKNGDVATVAFMDGK